MSLSRALGQAIAADNNKLHAGAALGVGWTYARRYSLSAILGIGSGDQDLDASDPPAEKESQEQTPVEQIEFRQWYDGQIKHYTDALGLDGMDAVLKEQGIGDLAAIKTRGEATNLIKALASAVDKASGRRFSMTIQEIFAGRLRQARKNKRLSQKNLATMSGLPPSHIAHFESQRRGASMANLVKLSKALGVSTDFLLGLSNDDGKELFA